MSTATLEKMASQVLKLPPTARAYLAERLLESLHEEDDFAVSAEWLAEAKRRGREIDAGRAGLVSGGSVLRSLRKPNGK